MRLPGGDPSTAAGRPQVRVARSRVVMSLDRSREPPNMSSLEPTSTEAWQRPRTLQPARWERGQGAGGAEKVSGMQAVQVHTPDQKCSVGRLAAPPERWHVADCRLQRQRPPAALFNPFGREGGAAAAQQAGIASRGGEQGWQGSRQGGSGAGQTSTSQVNRDAYAGFGILNLDTGSVLISQVH